jgi:ABC-type transporter Mla MlaB component
MIRIEMDQANDQLTLRVAGRLRGTNVEALEECWNVARLLSVAGKRDTPTMSVDLRDVTSIDKGGWCLLRLMHREGVRVSGKGLATQTILDELTEKEEPRL